MKITSIVLVTLATIAILAGQCTATVSCYSCTSVLSSGCNEFGFQPTAATSTSCNYCKKHVTTVNALILSTTTVSRSCEATCSESHTNIFGTRDDTYCCNDKTLCNGSTTVTASLTAAVAPVIFIIPAIVRMI